MSRIKLKHPYRARGTGARGDVVVLTVGVVSGVVAVRGNAVSLSDAVIDVVGATGTAAVKDFFSTVTGFAVVNGVVVVALVDPWVAGTFFDCN